MGAIKGWGSVNNQRPRQWMAMGREGRMIYFCLLRHATLEKELEPAGVGDRKPGEGLHGRRVCAIHVSHRGVPPPMRWGYVCVINLVV